MNASHTPGPWRICYDGQIDGADGRRICSFGWNSFREFNEDAEYKATARLLAAAPDLLAALQNVVNKYAARSDGTPSFVLIASEQEPCIADAMNAIAKATRA